MPPPRVLIVDDRPQSRLQIRLRLRERGYDTIEAEDGLSGWNAFQATLRRTRGNVGRSAEILGISRRTLYHWMDRYGISYREP